MVAYSFKAQFAEPIVNGEKCQTVRGARKRHAREGEAIQLYTAMRTKHCRKLIAPDPICVDVRPIKIGIGSRDPRIITGMEIDGVELDDVEIEAFAVADGFGSELVKGFARRRMGEFWVQNYEWNKFIGVVIRWRPSR
ncbi:MAG: ASCH domain-containing protein [Sphingopyxis sp.]|uniref:hypothetical protein n=1 Tax=Sphingopyxis sp. TaxID=1908224 RepID=UPI003D80DE3F